MPMSYQEQFQNHNKHDICQVRIGSWVKIGSLPCQGYYTSPVPIWFIFFRSMSILSHALGFSTFRKNIQKHIVERLLFASTRCCGGGFLKRPAGCFCPEYAELLFFPAAGAWGRWIGRYVHPVHGSSLVCPLFNPSPWYTSPWYARPPRLFLLCLLHSGYSGTCAVPSCWGVNLKNIKFPVSEKQPASTATLLTFSPRWTFLTIYSPIYTCNHLSSATQILHHTEKSTLNNKKSFKSGLKSQHHNKV